MGLSSQMELRLQVSNSLEHGRAPGDLAITCGQAFGFKAKSNLVWLTAT